jgi:thioredoxin 1
MDAYIYLIEGEEMSDNGNVHQVSDAGFEGDVLKSETPVLVDFWAPWCGPCRSVAPLVDDLATQYQGKLKVAKVNVDESSQVAMKYQVTSIPTFILFKNGAVADRVLGALPRSEFVKFLDRNL